MAEKYDVHVKVISQKGTCSFGHKVGEEWVIGSGTVAGICFSAFGAIYPNIRVLKFGGSFPWESDPEVGRCVCPDAANPVVFEFRRIRKK